MYNGIQDEQMYLYTWFTRVLTGCAIYPECSRVKTESTEGIPG